MPDEDITQDPHVVICRSEAGAAAKGWQLQGTKGLKLFGLSEILQGKGNTYLNGVSRGWEGEFLPLDVKCHIGH